MSRIDDVAAINNQNQHGFSLECLNDLHHTKIPNNTTNDYLNEMINSICRRRNDSEFFTDQTMMLLECFTVPDDWKLCLNIL